MKKLVSAAIVTAMLAGCAGTNQETGTIAGGALGVALGSLIGDGNGKTAAMILGGLFGATLGNSIGSKLDERDRLLLENSTYDALEYNRSNTSERWNNPDTGHYGTVTPDAAFTNRGGKVCRNFTQTIYIEGKRETGYGQACRVGNKWEMQ